MRVALLGSAPSSTHLAPFSDPSWEIWACSPSVASADPKFSVWFELHPFIPGAANMAQWYVDWMGKLEVPVYMQRREPLIPTSRAYPFRHMVGRYGPRFFTSSIAWMFALALEQEDIEEIGMWGIDLAASSEYGQQKPAVLRFVELAEERGIKVTAPPQSDVLQPPPLYGIWESTPMGAKLKARREELLAMLNKASADVDDALLRQKHLQGALEDLEYTRNTWVHGLPPDG